MIDRNFQRERRLSGNGAYQRYAGTQGILRLWDTWSHVCLQHHPPPPFLQSFRFIVDFWGGSLQIPEQVALIETLEEPTQFKVSVRLGPVFRIGGWRRGHGAEESRETPGGIKWGRTRLWDCMHGSSDSLPAVHHRAQHSPPSLASPHAGKD